MTDTTAQPLARRFSALSLLRFALPGVAMMFCLTVYTLVDGVFIARCVGSLGLSAQTMFGPLWSLEIGTGVMLAAGGSALIGKRLGQRRVGTANRLFTALVLLTAGLGAAVTAVASVLNGVLDYVLMVPLGMGMSGAALTNRSCFNLACSSAV